MAKEAFLSESDGLQILRRYSAPTVVELLREVARCGNRKLDWNVLVRHSSTGITSAREYQALWRHLAYRAELDDCYEDDAKPLNYDSDLEVELKPSPVVNADANADNAEALQWVKADLRRLDTQGKRKAELQSRSKAKHDVHTVTATQTRISGVSGDGVDASNRGTSAVLSVLFKDSSPASPPSGIGSQLQSVTPNFYPGSISKIGSGHSERKKRKLWSLEEDQDLIAAVEKFGEGNWTNILKGDFTHERSAAQLSQRWALIRKRADVQASVSKLPSGTASPSPIDGHGREIDTSPADISVQANFEQNAGDNADVKPQLPLSAEVGNGFVNQDTSPTTGMGPVTSSSGTQSQVAPVINSSSTPLAVTGVNGALKVSPPTSEGLNFGGIVVLAGTNGGQSHAQADCAAARSTAGCSSVMASAQVSNGSVSAGVGAGRLIAPGAHVMSAAAAQAASVGGSEMWNAGTAAVLVSGQAKFVVWNSGGLGISMKPLVGPDPGVQAAAVAAGARIAPASAAASLLKAAHSGNVVHIGPGGVPISKSGLPTPTGGHNVNGGSRGSPGAIVHYICTGAAAPSPAIPGINSASLRPAPQIKNLSTKPSPL